MNCAIRYSLAACLAMAVAGAQATLLTFEDLNPAPAQYDVMPAPYNGLTFSGWFFGPDSVYTPASGAIDLFTDYANPDDPGDLTITNSNNVVTSSTPFILAGAWFSGYSGVTFELWLSGSLVHTSATLPDAPGVEPYLPTFLDSGYAGFVDKVVVSGVQGYYAMDDFTFRFADTAVPAPTTFALALLGVGLLVRRSWLHVSFWSD